MKLEEVQNKLLAEVQSLPPEMALEICNQALKSIYRERDWSFLYKRDFLRTPALIQTGTVLVTKFSSDVVVSADLKAILDAITVDDVPLIGRQFRTFGGQIAGSDFFYNIIDYNPLTSTLRIDPFYQDATNVVAKFQIFKNLYNAPELIERDSQGNILFQGIDFANFEYISAPFVQRRLWLDYSRADLDRIDSARVSMGDPRYVSSYGLDEANNQLFELYPIPQQERLYKVLYKRTGRNLEPEDNLPPSLSYDLVLAKSKIKAFKWLAVNGSKVNDKTSPNIYLQSAAMLNNPGMDDSYPKLLAECKGVDENLYPQNLIDMDASFPYYREVIVETVLMDF